MVFFRVRDSVFCYLSASLIVTFIIKVISRSTMATLAINLYSHQQEVFKKEKCMPTTSAYIL